MGSKKRSKRCRRCGMTGVDLSHRGFCKTCRAELHAEMVEQLRAKEGPIYERWKKAVMKALDKPTVGTYSADLHEEAVEQLRLKEGPIYERWKSALIKGLDKPSER